MATLRTTAGPRRLTMASSDLFALGEEEDSNRTPIPYVSPPGVERRPLPYNFTSRAEE